MKKYIAVLELEDEDEIFDAKVSYMYHSFDMNYTVTESVELKEESENARNKTYEDGLNEAWELARRIVCLPEDGGETVKWLEDTFGTARTHLVFRKYSASEAIDAIEKYESERFNVGDEVKYRSEVGVVLEFDDDSISVMRPNGRTTIIFNKQELEKTGRNFTQIEEVLKQLKEGKNE